MDLAPNTPRLTGRCCGSRHSGVEMTLRDQPPRRRSDKTDERRVEKHMKKTFIALSLLAAATLATTPALAQGNKKSPVPGKPGDTNIVDIAKAVNAETGEFSYLLGAIGCLADENDYNPVVDLLSGDDMFTVFAPTDAAFIALQEALEIASPSPDATCALGDETVFNVLAYHVTWGRRFSNSVFNDNNPKLIEMLNEAYLRSNPDQTLTDVAGQTIGFVSTDLINLNASNGVIHVIDTVLLPFVP